MYTSVKPSKLLVPVAEVWMVFWVTMENHVDALFLAQPVRRAHALMKHITD